MELLLLNIRRFKIQTVISCASQYQEDDISLEKGKLFCTDPVVIPLGGTPPTITPGDPDVPEPDPTDPEDPDNPQPDKDRRPVRMFVLCVWV